jgi:hypothetical protein
LLNRGRHKRIKGQKGNQRRRYVYVRKRKGSSKTLSARADEIQEAGRKDQQDSKEESSLIGVSPIAKAKELAKSQFSLF